jgi:hypothetical protein
MNRDRSGECQEISDEFGAVAQPVTISRPPDAGEPPFTVKLTHLLQADTDVLEYVCTENEKERAHITK